MGALPAAASRRLAPPEPTRQLLVRPRLLTLLQQRFERRLTTLVAGPGFGKTSLLAQAVAENRLSPRGVDAWVGCQPEDSVASTLARKLLAAVEGTDPAPPSLEAAVDLVEAGVWRRSPTPVVLLLDDTHLIPPGSPGARLLTALVERLPANGHLLLAGRLPLPLPTARLAALGQTGELDERELAFDPDELAAFAALRHIPPELVEQTGGWPAMAELTASIGEHRAVDFLWEELLLRLPAERRRLLAALVVVGGGDEEVAAGLADGPVNLDELVAGLPLISGRPGGWRSLHPLWAPALARQLSDGAADDMRRRAAAVLRRRGMVDPAVRLLTQAQAWDEVRTVICDTGAASHPLVATDVFAAWYSGLPKDLQHGPEGLLLRGLVNKGRDLPAAMQLLERAAEKFRLVGHVRGETAALIHLAHISWWCQDRSRLAAVAQRVAELTQVGSDDLIAFAVLAQVLLADVSGESRRVLKLLAAIPADTISNEWSATVEWFRAWELLALGEPEQAKPHAAAAVAQAMGTFHSTSIHLQVLTRWFSGGIQEALDELPVLADATMATGRAHNIVFERGTCALLLAYTGRGEAAQDHLIAARAALPGTRGGAGELVYALAEMASLIGNGEEERAGQMLVAELAQRPLDEHPRTSQLHRLFLALSYLLVPPTRLHWDAAELGPRFQTTRELARALAAGRETGSLTELAAVQLPGPEIVQALLPVPWAIELAAALTAVGRPEGQELLAALGSAARPTVKRLADTAQPALARAARRLLADLPHVPHHHLRLDVLGPLRLRRNGQPVDHPEVRRERVRQLLAYLVVYSTTTREAITAALWPDLDEEVAGRNLRVTLTYLQRLLEPDRAEGDPPFFVRTSGTGLQLIGDEWLEVDVWQFDRLLDQAAQAERQGVPSRALAAYQQALPLYRGEYLADLPDVDWAELERNRLRLRYQSAAIRAGELLLAGGDTAAPLTLGHAALRVEPWSEPAYRLLIAAHLAAGDHAAARRTLHRCQAMLADLGAHPEPQTQMLARRLTPPTPAGRPGSVDKSNSTRPPTPSNPKPSPSTSA